MVERVLSLIGDAGLLAVPYHPVADPKKVSHSRMLFDAETVRPHGLSGVLLAKGGAVRSEAPVFALAGVGREAAKLMDGQLDAAPFAMGVGSPWAKMLHRPVRMVMTRGAGSVNYGLLLAAHLRYADYDRPAFFHRPFPFLVRTQGGDQRELAFHLNALPFQARYELGGYADFDRFMDYLDDKCGLYAKARIGALELVAFDYAAQFQACLQEMAGENYLEDARYW